MSFQKCSSAEYPTQMASRCTNRCRTRGYGRWWIWRVFHSEGKYSNCQHRVSHEYSLEPIVSLSEANYRLSAISKDPKVFRDPDEFKPERFSEPEYAHDLTFDNCFFGFGRRVCPGQYVGLQSLFIVVSRFGFRVNYSNSILNMSVQAVMGIWYTPTGRLSRKWDPAGPRCSRRQSRTCA